MQGRVTAGCQYIGPPMERELAERILHASPKLTGDVHAPTILAALDHNTWRTAGSIARRTGLSTQSVAKTIRRLVGTRQVVEQKVGRRVAYGLP